MHSVEELQEDWRLFVAVRAGDAISIGEFVAERNPFETNQLLESLKKRFDELSLSLKSRMASVGAFYANPVSRPARKQNICQRRALISTLSAA